VSSPDALWSAQEVRTQAAQCSGQVDIWEALSGVDPLAVACDECSALAGEPCDLFCTARPFCECPKDGFLCDECAEKLA
jgi:hypothetical protein